MLRGAVGRPAKPRRRCRSSWSPGPKDHGPGEHDYPPGSRRGRTCWRGRQRRRRDRRRLADGPAAWRDGRRGRLLLSNRDWTPEQARELDAFLARGGGRRLPPLRGRRPTRTPEALAQRIGLAWQGGRSRSSATARSTWTSPARRSTRSRAASTSGPASSTRATGSWSAMPRRSRSWRRRSRRARPQPLFWTLRGGQGPGVRVASPATTPGRSTTRSSACCAARDGLGRQGAHLPVRRPGHGRRGTP